jgi:hypothetical protein
MKIIEKFKKHPDTLLFWGSGLVSVGIITSFLLASELIFSKDHKTLTNSFLLLSNLTILSGTFCIGLGFYLKAINEPQEGSNENKDSLSKRISAYGQFMLGIAALITLPQTPEMLRYVMDIRRRKRTKNWRR